MPAPATARPGFSLQLGRAPGAFVLTDRLVAGLLRVETLALSLDQVPGRLDLHASAPIASGTSGRGWTPWRSPSTRRPWAQR
ncbi:MAG: hypothetical protein R3F43_18010 [bacterium]